MSFRDIVEDHLSSVFFNTDHFGEEFEYTPADGEARTISGAVVSSGSRRSDEAHHLADILEMQILFRRHASAGVLSPRLGDSLQRVEETLTQPDGSPVIWDFQYIVDETDLSSLTLQFQAIHLLRAGQIRPSNL